jgi:hypothetical protein
MLNMSVEGIADTKFLAVIEKIIVYDFGFDR